MRLNSLPIGRKAHETTIAQQRLDGHFHLVLLAAERARTSGLQSSSAQYFQGFTVKSLSGGTLNPVSRPVSYSPSSTAFSASGPAAASSWYLQQRSHRRAMVLAS
jgi:hypothetical protein